MIRQVDEVKGIVGETVQALLATHENLEVLEDRGEQLRSQASTFHKTARAVKVVARNKNSRLTSIFCITVVALGAVAITPCVILYWDEIVAFLKTALPPGEEGSGEAMSGDAAAESGNSGSNYTESGALR